MTRMRFLAVVGVVISTIGVCVAVAAAAIKPGSGLYGGTENKFHNGEGAGYFNVVAGARGRKIVPWSGGPDIVVPTDFICKPGDITASNHLRAKQIPIKSGAFDYSGTPQRARSGWTDDSGQGPLDHFQAGRRLHKDDGRWMQSHRQVDDDDTAPATLRWPGRLGDSCGPDCSATRAKAPARGAAQSSRPGSWPLSSSSSSSSPCSSAVAETEPVFPAW